MKAICLVVVKGGVADVYEPEHVDCRVVDLDDVEAGSDPVVLPAGVGFEALAKRANLTRGVDFILPYDRDPFLSVK